MNSKKIILDLCGGTGSWSSPYLHAGYDVRLVTLPLTDVRTYQPPENVYGILAAPPCTMFSLARQRAKTPRNFSEGMETVEACLRIIWKCRIGGSLKFWALENPRSYCRQFLGKPPLTFSPCDYGDGWTKPTDLWGYYNEPKKNPATVVQKCVQGWSFAKRGHGGMTRAQLRAKTPDGFANAFFKANP